MSATLASRVGRVVARQPLRRLSGWQSDDGSTERKMRSLVLDCSLEHVATDGWTETSLAKGASDAGLSASAHGMFARGGVELVEHFQARCTKKMSQQLREMEMDK